MLALLMVLSMSIATTLAQDVTELTIWWAQWAPADYLQQIGNEPLRGRSGLGLLGLRSGNRSTRIGQTWTAQTGIHRTRVEFRSCPISYQYSW